MRKAATANARKLHFTAFTDIHVRDNATAAAEAEAAEIVNMTAQVEVSRVGSSG
jgi:hypothetical protein